MLKILRIAIPSPLRRSFDYLPPTDCNTDDLMPGVRVQVPFGRRKNVIGILLEISEKTEIPPDQLKTAIMILDETPLWPTSLLSLGKWASEYYQHPIGDVLVGTLPNTLRSISKETFNWKIPFTNNDGLDKTPQIELNTYQAQAVATLMSTTKFQTFLLDGITGSGKTEVYLHIIDHQLKQNKQALVLVPEIALTPQTINRFEKRFNVPIVVLHSGLSHKKRASAWLQASQGTAAIIIGTRSAIFTPLARPGIIILDEEHDPSFKQQTGFRYSARDLAVMRGRFENMPVILGSATPSLESLHNAYTGRYHPLYLPERAGKAMPPRFHLLDMRGLSLEYGLSTHLLMRLKEHLKQQGQVLLFLNRRGYSPILLCHACAWSALCKHCDAKLTLHQSPKKLHCHHCNATYPVFSQCPDCNSPSLITVGLGTERIEEGLQKYFPDTEVLRIDSDTTRGKGKLTTLLDRIMTGKPCIITGTQILAKGHHFPHVTMVAIIDADSGLYSADFRASERMAQLIIQVAGRAGREDRPGQVFIQTHNPNHPILQSLVNQGYACFAKQTLRERLSAALPPYTHLALIRVDATQQQDTLEFLNRVHIQSEHIKQTKNAYKKINTLGPITALMERKAGRFRAHLLFQTENRTALQTFLKALIPLIEKSRKSKRIRWSIDIDPIEIL